MQRDAFAYWSVIVIGNYGTVLLKCVYKELYLCLCIACVPHTTKNVLGLLVASGSQQS